MISRALLQLYKDLVTDGYIGQKQLQEALLWQKATGRDIYDYLVEKGYIKEETLAKFIAEKKNLPYVSLNELDIDYELVKLIPEKVVKKYNVLPISKSKREITVAMANPFDLTAINDIEFASGYMVVPVVTEKSSIKRVLDKIYQEAEKSLSEIMKLVKEEERQLEVLKSAKEDVDLKDLASAAEEAPIVRLANFIFSEAIKKKASDIHIEPYEDELRIRFRIDGVLHEVLNLSMNLHPGLSSRLKVMSDMDISERRIPQDGRMKIKVETI